MFLKNVNGSTCSKFIGEQAGHMVGNYNRIACPLNKS